MPFHMTAAPSCERALNEHGFIGSRELERRPRLAVENGLLFKPRAPHGVSLSNLAKGVARTDCHAIHSPKAFWVRFWPTKRNNERASFAHGQFPERTPRALVRRRATARLTDWIKPKVKSIKVGRGPARRQWKSTHEREDKSEQGSAFIP